MIKAVIFDMYETLITVFDGPGYTVTGIVRDSGIPEEAFFRVFTEAEKDRSTGKVTTEELIERLFEEYGTEARMSAGEIMQKLVNSTAAAFGRMNPEIIPMLESLKKRGIKTGLISNCYSEETGLIKSSVLFPYFDAVCLSYEEGVRKPDPEIFERCLAKLGFTADECLYVGDGGSGELAAAKKAGMSAAQAVWYLREGTRQPAKRMPEYPGIGHPLEIESFI